jgi:hypothetical protein
MAAYHHHTLVSHTGRRGQSKAYPAPAPRKTLKQLILR